MTGLFDEGNFQAGTFLTGYQKPGPVFAFLTNDTHDLNSEAMWRGIQQAAAQAGGSALCFVGTGQIDTGDFTRSGSYAYYLVDKERLDGLILWGSMLNVNVPREHLEEFIRRFDPLPVVSIGMELAGAHAVIPDNYQAICASVAHLVERHHRRRIAVIGGPEAHIESTLRLRGFQDSLARFHLPYNPALVYWGSFSPDDGRQAVEGWLDGQPPGRTPFDALLTCDDCVAVEAIETLRRLGLRVPDDVSVIGFDDQAVARCFTPPLTTSGLPNYELGQMAGEVLANLLRGQPTPQVQMAPMRLVVRQSCGCPSLAAQRVRSPRGVEAPRQPLMLLAENAGQINQSILRDLGMEGLSPGCIESITGPFIAEMMARGAGRGCFLPAFDRFIQEHRDHPDCAARLDDLLSTMRCSMLPYLVGRTRAWMKAEDLWQQARVLLSENLRRWEAYHALQQSLQDDILHQITQNLITTYDHRLLSELIYSRLPEIGIRGCYLSLYENSGSDMRKATEWARLVVACHNGRQVALPEEGVPFLSRRLVPEGFPLCGDRRDWIVEPLLFNDEQIGFVLFLSGAFDFAMYEALRNQLGSVLKGGALHAAVLELSLTDSLTGLANRRAFNIYLAKEIERHARYGIELSLILLDIDLFKLYNDEFGHIAGDQALGHVGSMLGQVARRHLDVAARLGGDEFAVILSGTSLVEAERIAWQLRDQVRSHTGLLRPVTISLGVASAGTGPVDPLGLMERADQALYRSKNSGRNRVCVWTGENATG